MEIFIRPEDWFGIAIAGLVVLLMPGGIGAFLWRRFVPLKPIPLDVEAWSRFEQRRWTESAKALRHFISFVVFVALLAGTIGVPVLLGVAESPRWYLNEGWIGLFFGAVVVGVVCWYVVSGRVRDRCPKCHSPQLAKAMARNDTWDLRLLRLRDRVAHDLLHALERYSPRNVPSSSLRDGRPSGELALQASRAPSSPRAIRSTSTARRATSCSPRWCPRRRS